MTQKVKIVILIVLIMLFTCSCVPKKVSNNNVRDTTTATTTTSTSSVDNTTSYESDSNRDSGGWIDEIPAVIPKFSYGSLEKDQSAKTSSNDSSYFFMHYQNVTKGDVEDYRNKLKASGFDITEISEGDNYMVGGTLIKDSTRYYAYAQLQIEDKFVDYSVTVTNSKI